MAADLAAAQARVAELEAELARSSARDPLTPELLSLRAFRSQLDVDIQRSRRHERPLAVVVLDLDGFRQVNVRYGIAAGDVVLGAVGRTVARLTRAHDRGCRMAGDEFALMLPETSLEEAVAVVGRLVTELERVQAGGVDGVTASVGVSVLGPVETAEVLLERARTALELARAEGGARIKTLAPGNADAAAARAEADANGGASDDVVAALASALAARDPHAEGHSDSVVELAGQVGETLALPAHEIRTVRTAALLHDIGKVGIPDAILNKPGPLEEDEWQVMRNHPVVGERIVRAIPGMAGVARIVRHEHERWDGGGYPDGLAGDAIPLGSRIVLACDAYHAMISERSYRSALPHTNAMRELIDNAGIQFDPTVVEALVGLLYGRRQTGAAAPAHPMGPGLTQRPPGSRRAAGRIPV